MTAAANVVAASAGAGVGGTLVGLAAII